MVIIAMPIIIINTSSWDELMGVSPFWFIFSLAWMIIAPFGLIFETIADRQLATFLKIKKPGEIFTSGLYRYSRHPNYFGESMFWLGISCISVPYTIIWLISWVMITILLLFVSGVPIQEARYVGRPNWEEYKARTSVFIPWFNRK
jgi:steroid 5-alpha reductase family enzyme